MLSAVQFFRLADRLESLPPIVRRVAESIAAGDSAAAESIAGGKGSPDWWAAEFFLTSLAEHGINTAPRKAAPPRAPALFAD